MSKRRDGRVSPLRCFQNGKTFTENCFSELNCGYKRNAGIYKKHASGEDQNACKCDTDTKLLLHGCRFFQLVGL